MASRPKVSASAFLHFPSPMGRESLTETGCSVRQKGGR